jgi:hypothetical protein
MVDDRVAIARRCFAILLAVGIGLLLLGLAVEPITPAITLDRVLTSKELTDPAKRESTMALLKRAQGNRWLLWSLAGLLVVAPSGVGLWATRGRGRPSGAA